MERRIITILIAAVAAVTIWPAPEAVEASGLPADVQAMVDDVVARYEAAGLVVPNTPIKHDASEGGCGGYAGVYSVLEDVITICRGGRLTIAHELAHAWIARNVDQQTRLRFMERWDAPAWSGPGIEWRQRGTERAADTIAYAMIITSPTPSGNIRSYLCGYEQLTGMPLPVQLDLPCANVPMAQ